MKKLLLILFTVLSYSIIFSQADYALHDLDQCISSDNWFNTNVTVTIPTAANNPDVADTANPLVTHLLATATNGSANFEIPTYLPVDSSVDWSIRMYSENAGAINSGSGRVIMRLFNKTVGGAVANRKDMTISNRVAGWSTLTGTIDTNGSSQAVIDAGGYNAFYVIPSNSEAALEPLYIDDFKTSVVYSTHTLAADNAWIDYIGDSSANFTSRTANEVTYSQVVSPTCASSTVSKVVRGDQAESSLTYELSAPLIDAGKIKFKVLTEAFTSLTLMLRTVSSTSGVGQQFTSVNIPLASAGIWQDVEWDFGAALTTSAASYNYLVIRTDFNQAATSTGETYYFDGLQAPTAAVDADGDGEAADTDCDDSDAAINSSATEVLYDGIDNDCNAATLDTVDADGDGENSDTDCDDSDAAINSSASEVLYDGIDNDCNAATLDTVDADGDGENSDTDCDDSDAAINSSAAEVLYDGIDNDCNAATLDTVDADGDGENSDTDCDDSDAAINSSATEVLYDGIDNDCNAATLDTVDADGDGENSDTDCDDSDAAINSSATEVLYDGIDNDCDSLTLDTVDADGDGENSDTDCDDSDAAINSSAAEVLYDGIDNDCDPLTLDTVDADGDGENSDTDCDDSDSLTYSGAAANDSTTACMTDADGDGYGDINGTTAGTDCDDSDSMVNPGATEIQNDGIDNDCDPSTSDTLSIENHSGLTAIKLYPQPFKDFITISLPKQLQISSLEIKIYDLNGRLIINQTKSVNQRTIVINGLSNLQNATYFMFITNSEGKETIVKQILKMQ